MTSYRLSIYFLLLFTADTALTQPLPLFHNAAFEVESSPLKWPLAGGLHAPQFSTVDANGDGLQDLYIFDRLDYRQLVFIQAPSNEGITYTYAPAWASHFPDMENWVLLEDYNGDGISDIFTSRVNPDEDVSGVLVYNGYYDQDSIKFSLASINGPIAYTSEEVTNPLPIFVDALAYPAIGDMDCDGDLDILAFDLNGGSLKMYCNQSFELGFDLDSLIFSLCNPCWGGFFESPISPTVELATAADICASTGGLLPPPPHGGVSLLEMDADGDGDMDLWLGSSAFNSLNLLTNAGNCTVAWINAQNTDALAPSGTLPSFPTAYHLDANNDGLKDLLVCPSFRLAANDRRAVVWRYQNTGTASQPVFVFQENDFMVADMVDLGTGAHPAFADINADGLLDLVIGNTSLASDYEAYQARIFLFLNTGTPQAPVFTLINEDFLEMSQFEASSNSFAPTFGDLDGDGDLDLLIGEWLGGLFFAENTAGTGQPMEFPPPVYGYQSIDVGQFSTPHILDITGDGLPDLLIGERNGNINFFPNVGTASQPLFIGNPATPPNNPSFGGVDTRTPGSTSGLSSPFVIPQLPEGYILLTGSENGAIEGYRFSTTEMEDAFHQVEDFVSPQRLGTRTHPVLADVNNDGRLELWLGNQSGGLIAFESEWQPIPSPNIILSVEIATPVITVFPNPTKDLLTITAQNQPSFFSTWHIFDMAGHCVLKGALPTTKLSIDISHLAQGVYYLSVVTDYAHSVQRFIVQ